MGAVVLVVLLITVVVAQDLERAPIPAEEVTEVQEVDTPGIEESPMVALPACGPGLVHRNLTRPWNEARYWQGAGAPCTLERVP